MAERKRTILFFVVVNVVVVGRVLRLIVGVGDVCTCLKLHTNYFVEREVDVCFFLASIKLWTNKKSKTIGE